MGSNEPLGTPTDLGQGDVETGEENNDLGRTDAQSGKAKEAGTNSSKGSDEKERGGKRRKLAQEKIDLINDMIKAVDCWRCPQGSTAQ